MKIAALPTTAPSSCRLLEALGALGYIQAYNVPQMLPYVAGISGLAAIVESLPINQVWVCTTGLGWAGLGHSVRGIFPTSTIVQGALFRKA